MRDKDYLPQENDTLAAGVETEPVPDWAHLPEGKPEEFGFPTDSHNQQKIQMWNRQEAFLEAYRQIGKIGKAAKAVGLTRWAVDYWVKKDIFGFQQRIKAAHQDYVEEVIEEGMIDHGINNPIKGVQGSDVLVMFKAKAEAPDKYREEVKVIGTEAPLRMLEKLKELGKRELEQEEQKALEAPVVEAVYREVSVAGQEPTVKTPPRPEGGGYTHGTLRPSEGMAREVNQTAKRQGVNKGEGRPGRKVNKR